MNPLLKTPEVWTVIHVQKGNLSLALSNAALADEAGCRGVFLISMEGHDEELVDFAKVIKAEHPTLGVGVNHLSKPPIFSLRVNAQAGLDATWTDYPGICSLGASEEALRTTQVLGEHPGHLFFASVAFKYQAVEKLPGGAAQAALNLGMIPTTSGEATGIAADRAKLEGIREWIGAEAPLAIASGVTPENAKDHVGLVTHILVATGISADFHTFSQERLSALMGQVK